MKIVGTMKKLMAWGLASVAIVLFSFFILFSLAQTDWGKGQNARILAALLTKSLKVQVEAGRLHGVLPFDIRLDRMAFRDPLGEWMVMEEAILQWEPKGLVRGRFHIRHLKAATVRLDRFPSSGKEQHKVQGLPPWPPPVPPIMIESFALLLIGSSWGRPSGERVLRGPSPVVWRLWTRLRVSWGNFIWNGWMVPGAWLRSHGA